MSVRTAAVDRPEGFSLLAVLLGWLVMYGVGDVVSAPPAAWHRPAAMIALKLLFTVLCAVGAEALWKVRPWASGVARALAAVAWVYALAGLLEVETDVMAVLLIYAGVLWLFVRYVDTQVQRRYGPSVILKRRRRVPWRVP
jgi:hypothetical protein